MYDINNRKLWYTFPRKILRVGYATGFIIHNDVFYYMIFTSETRCFNTHKSQYTQGNTVSKEEYEATLREKSPAVTPLSPQEPPCTSNSRGLHRGSEHPSNGILICWIS